MPVLEGCCVDLLGEGDGGVCETIYTVSALNTWPSTLLLLGSWLPEFLTLMLHYSLDPPPKGLFS